MTNNSRTSPAGARRRSQKPSVTHQAELINEFDISTMTFVRALEAFRYLSAPTSGSPAFADWVGTNVLVGDNMGDGAGILYRLEGERTNLVRNNRDASAAGWTASGFGTLTINQGTGPDGSVTADEHSGPSAGYGAYSLFAVSDLLPFAVSAFVRTISGTGDGAIGASNAGSNVWSPRLALTTTYQRGWVQHIGTAALSGYAIPWDGREGADFAFDYLADLTQMEVIQATEPRGPSSPIRTPSTATVTRPADELTDVTANFPAWVCTAGEIEYISPGWASADQVNGMQAWVISWTTGDGINGIFFERDGTDLRLKITRGGVIKATSAALTFAAHDLLGPIAWNAAAGTLTIDGVGGAVVPWTWSVPSATFRIGENLFGRVSPVWTNSIVTLPIVTISGDILVGETLTASESGPVTSRQWQRGNVIGGEGTYSACGGSDSGLTYTVVAADIGYTIRCVSTNYLGSTASVPLEWGGLENTLASETGIFDETGQSGSPIDSWTKSAGTTANWEQTGIYRPAAGTFNGLAAPDFDGTNDYMTQVGLPAASDIIAAAGYEYWIGFIADTASTTSTDPRSGNLLFKLFNDYLACSVGTIAGVPKVSACHFDTNVRTVSETITLGAKNLVNVSFNGSRVRLSLNGGADVTIAAGNLGDIGNFVAIGGNSAALSFDGKIGVFITCQAEQTTTARATTTAYLRNKWGTV